MNKINTSIKRKCKKIKIVITDVDGVLTDGGRYYSSKGEELKKFHVRDGMGVNILLRNNIKTIIVTKEKSKIVTKWASEMNVFQVFPNSIRKEETFDKILKKFKAKPEEIAYIGDDINDIEISKKAGLSATPHDGDLQLKKIVDYVCDSQGGIGAFREIVDLIMTVKYPKKIKWY